MNSSRELLQAGRKVRLLAALASVPSAIARSAGARASASTSAGGANARSAGGRASASTSAGGANARSAGGRASASTSAGGIILEAAAANADARGGSRVKKNIWRPYLGIRMLIRMVILYGYGVLQGPHASQKPATLRNGARQITNTVFF